MTSLELSRTYAALDVWWSLTRLMQIYIFDAQFELYAMLALEINVLYEVCE